MRPLTLDELTELVMQQAAEKGFGTKPEEINVGEKIALIHTEVSEAYEAYRNKVASGKDGLPSELADAVIRIIHLSAVLKIDLEEALLEKIEINKGRTWDFDKLNETHPR